jgi:cytochrome P450
MRSHPGLIRAAVHELLRFDSPTHMVPRFAAADSVLGGKRIRRGDTVLALVGAANRDPAAFAEPDCLDLDRDARKQLGFGQGDHICLGAPLALVILERTLMAMVQRFSRIELIGPPLYGGAIQLRIPDRMVVRCE